MTDLRTDLAGFAKRVLHRPLWDHQLEAAASDRFIVSILHAGRSASLESLRGGGRVRAYRRLSMAR